MALALSGMALAVGGTAELMRSGGTIGLGSGLAGATGPDGNGGTAAQFGRGIGQNIQAGAGKLTLGALHHFLSLALGVL